MSTIPATPRFVSLLCLASMVLFVACSGGDDGGDPNDTSGTTTTTTTTTSGTDTTGTDSTGTGTDTTGTTAQHGDICFDQGNCSSGTNLLCTFDEPGAAQGICRFICSGFDDCLGNDGAFGAGDTDCCDVSGGTRICADSFDYPNATCD